MREITSNLYLADIEQVGIHTRYEEHGIGTVIRLSHSDPENGYPADVDVYEYPMADGPGNDQGAMSAAVARTASLLSAGETVVVHCCAGDSRSVAVCMAAIAVSRGGRFQPGVEARRVRKARPRSPRRDGQCQDGSPGAGRPVKVAHPSPTPPPDSPRSGPVNRLALRSPSDDERTEPPVP